MSSFKPEVVADTSGEWCGNQLRFATEHEAQQYVMDLMWRWTLVRNTRVTYCDDPVTAQWKDGRLIHVKEEEREQGTS